MEEELVEFTLWVFAISVGISLSAALIRVTGHLVDAAWVRLTARLEHAPEEDDLEEEGEEGEDDE